MTPEDYYYDAELEEQLIIEEEWRRFEESKLNKEQAKIVPFSIAYPDKEVNAIIIEKGE